MTDTRTMRIEGIATALTSITHGGEHAGTTGFLAREKVITSNGVVEVPRISGNSVRGILRDHCARIMWEVLDRPELPLAVFHLLWSGGSLAKTSGAKTLGARQLAQVRAMVPAVSLFGGSGAGKIIGGKLRVGHMIPVCVENAHRLPQPVVEGEGLPSVWDLIQIEEFTRRDDSKRDQLHPMIEGFAPKALEPPEGALLTVPADTPAIEDDVDGPAQQMRYGVETLAAGTRLHWWISLHDVTDVEVALFAAAIDAWVADGAAVGGRSATGHGRLRLDMSQWTHQSPQVTVGEALAVPGDPLTVHVDAHRDEIIEALGWFA